MSCSCSSSSLSRNTGEAKTAKSVRRTFHPARLRRGARGGLADASRRRRLCAEARAAAVHGAACIADEVRADFPLIEGLRRGSVEGAPIYFDNAATSQKPAAVLAAVQRFYEHDNSNVHRGVHSLSQRATDRYEAARASVARLINCKSPLEGELASGGASAGGGADGYVVFTRGATEAINLVAYSWATNVLQRGDEIVLSVAEHHSNIVPWQLVAKKTGAVLRFVSLTEGGEEIDMKDLRAKVNEKTRCVSSPRPPSPRIPCTTATCAMTISGCCTFVPVFLSVLSPLTDSLSLCLNPPSHRPPCSPLQPHAHTHARTHACRHCCRLISLPHVSNVLGSVLDVEEVVSIADGVRGGAESGRRCKVLLDACQSVPHMRVDAEALGVDWLVASGHKMCAPTGIGFLYGRADVMDSMQPFMGGGEMIRDVFLEESTFAPPPARFEAGTPAIGEAVGLGEACEYLMRIGMDRIHAYECDIAARLYHKLEAIDGVRIYGPRPNAGAFHRAALCSFNVDGVHATDLAQILDMNGVAIRSGHHCCQVRSRNPHIRSLWSDVMRCDAHLTKCRSFSGNSYRLIVPCARTCVRFSRSPSTASSESARPRAPVCTFIIQLRKSTVRPFVRPGSRSGVVCVRFDGAWA